MIVLFSLLIASLIYAVADGKIQKAGDLCIGNIVIPSFIIADMIANRFFGNEGTTKYYYSINGIKGAGTTNSLMEIFLFFIILGILCAVMAKLSEVISKKVFKKENEDEINEKIGVRLMIIASAIVGLVGIRYLYFGIMYRSVLSFLCAAVLLTISIYQLKKYLVDKNYRTKKVI